MSFFFFYFHFIPLFLALLQSAEMDIKDVQQEFEVDRQDYLDTIRHQEQQLRLHQQILDRVLPCLRRDCNYINIDWVKSAAEWDDDSSTWQLPPLKVTKTALPSASPSINSARSMATPPPLGLPDHNGPIRPSMYDGIDDEKLRQRLERSGEPDYFKPKRAAQLLAEAKSLKGSGEKSSPISPSANRLGALPHPSQLPPSIGGNLPPPKANLSHPNALKPLNHTGFSPQQPGSHLDMPNSLDRNIDKMRVRHRSLQPLNDKRFNSQWELEHHHLWLTWSLYPISEHRANTNQSRKFARKGQSKSQ